MKNNGLSDTELSLGEAALRDLVRYYTREAGVRSLEREIAKICRKGVTAHTLKKAKGKLTITPRNLDKYLGVRRYTYGMAEQNNQVGQVTGLAWTEVGGELLTIEANIMSGKGNIIRTGQLGDVMKESIEAARTVVRSRAKGLGIAADMFEKHDMHVHLPEGATPKDGPSAGIALCVAMASVWTGIPVRCEVAMTGEITLRGEVLPIGGLKEKLLAAHRGGIKKVLIPEGNVKDLVEIPDNIKNRLEIQPVKWIEQVFEATLERLPEPLTDTPQATPAPVAQETGQPAVIKH
jgi:ATP-dependent Lon protease